MKTFSIKEVFERGWEIWKGNKKVLTLITLFILLVGLVPNPADGIWGKTVFEALLFIVTTFVGMGYVKTMLLVEKGEKVEFGEIFRHARYFWRYLIASILYGLLAGLGLVVFIVPGIYFALKYTFVLTLIVDKDLKIGEAFTQSGILTEGVKWKLLGFWGAAALAAILGLLALGVGLLVASPVIALASIVVYRKLLEQSSNVNVV